MLEVYSADVCFKQCNTFFQFLNPLEIKAAFDLFFFLFSLSRRCSCGAVGGVCARHF